jgi:hypothetical protein
MRALSRFDRATLSVDQWSRLGAYSSPFSSQGLEFLPLGAKPEEVGIVLHEVGVTVHVPRLILLDKLR